ncbi:DUF1206 domain-containing protein [Devosia nitrariae]|uniref:DUF1206 domain-containing protein n=1 Tax=Devosia nitrariae TaxID=2071872 RepID=A0ABQ5W7Q1_9HYPH|nr:DUF1206 domain-containing protein [Devosia nitrariae]GLQ55897.1 hypothetical protein GCM10010862_31560 [Devosia nitrariae]
MQKNKFETFARLGYAARGVVYLLLGGFALASAFWGGGGSEDTSGALSGLLRAPFGRIWLGLVAFGLLGYVLWKLAQGLLNADNVDDDAKGFLNRAGQLVSAGANLFLMLTAARLAWSGGGGGNSNGEESASAWVLQQPFGPLLLGLVAAGVIAAALVQIWYGGSGRYRDRLHLPAEHRTWMDRACKFGLIARGVVIAIIGGFLGYAAFTVSPEQAGGVAEALAYVRGLPFGPWLYGAIALGLMAFGVYGLIEARYRSIDAPTLADVGK